MTTPPIWAPWRMDYILGERQGGCIFCDFPSRGPASFREDLVLVSQPLAFVCLNRYPFAASHLLVVPRRHVSHPSELSDDESIAFMRLVRDSIERLGKATRAEGMNVGMNLGKVAGAGIADHVHTHVVPRWAGDTNFMPVIADVRVMPEYLDASFCRLYPYFSDLPGERAAVPIAIK